VLLPSPFWTTYPECIKLAGGVSVEVFADETQNYLVSVEQLEAARTPKTKALLFCSPSNPTGSVYSPAQVKAIGEWAVKHNIWIISDEIYEHLLYDGATAPSLPVVVPALADTCIIINGVAKTYAMTGWRVGWMIGPKDVIKAATNLQSHLTSNVSNVSQRAAIAALTGNLDAVHAMGEAFNRRRKLIVDLLNEIPGFECPTPTGAFYVYPSVKGVLGTTIRGKTPTTSAELATLLLEEVEVAAVPGEAFGPSGYLRFSYATSDEDIVEGIGRIKKLITEG
jgi:aspartate/methionine/tyrosine aminotransferase